MGKKTSCSSKRNSEEGSCSSTFVSSTNSLLIPGAAFVVRCVDARGIGDFFWIDVFLLGAIAGNTAGVVSSGSLNELRWFVSPSLSSCMTSSAWSAGAR